MGRKESSPVGALVRQYPLGAALSQEALAERSALSSRAPRAP